MLFHSAAPVGGCWKQHLRGQHSFPERRRRHIAKATKGRNLRHVWYMACCWAHVRPAKLTQLRMSTPKVIQTVLSCLNWWSIKAFMAPHPSSEKLLDPQRSFSRVVRSRLVKSQPPLPSAMNFEPELACESEGVSTSLSFVAFGALRR